MLYHSRRRISLLLHKSKAKQRISVNNKDIPQLYCDITGFYSISGFVAFATVTDILQTGSSLRFRHLLSSTHLANTFIDTDVC